MIPKEGQVFGMDKRAKHGAYRELKKLDGRSREVRFVAEVESALATALGGDPSVQERLLLRRVAVKSMRLALMESELLKGSSDVSETLARDYLRWSREIREDLRLLGLKRRAKPLINLEEYKKEFAH